MNEVGLRSPGRRTGWAVAAAVTGITMCLVMPSLTPAYADGALVVDDDRADCPEADHTSIQAAVSAADPDGVILVCAGTYHETVTVKTDGLRIKGDGTIRPAVDGDGLRTRGFVLDGVQRVTIENFALRNHRQENVVLLGGGDNTVRDTELTGAPKGLAVVGSSGNLIEANFAFANSPASTHGIGINLTAGSAANIIRRNVTRGNGFGIQLSSAGSGNLVTHNVSASNSFAGISNVSTQETTIRHNTTSHNGRNGIVVARPHGFYAPLFATVEHNRSYGNGASGIALIHGGGNFVAYNRISHNQDGIALHESFDNAIERNHSSHNALDGIGIKDHFGHPLSARNVVDRNHLEANAEHDCHDDTVGSGTAGTANTWARNHAETENRPGLCTRAS